MPFPLIAALIGAAGSLGGALISSKAAKKAGEAQAGAAQANLDLSKEYTGQSLDELYTALTGALGNLEYGAQLADEGYLKGIADINRGFDAATTSLRDGAGNSLSSIAQAYDRAGMAARTGYDDSLSALARGYGTAVPTVSGGFNEAIRSANQGFGTARADVNAAFDRANPAIRAGYTDAAAAQQPFYDTGTGALTELANLVGLNGQTEADAALGRFQTSPGYQFQMNEGVNALDRSAAARGGLYSGAQGKALTEYGQGVANQEFNNRLSTLAGMAGSGQAAGNVLSELAMGRGAAEAGLETQRGMMLSDLARNLGLTVGGYEANRGLALGDMATQRGLAEADLASQLGLTLSGLEADQGRTAANVNTSLSQMLAQLAANQGQATSAMNVNRGLTAGNYQGALSDLLMNVAGNAANIRMGGLTNMLNANSDIGAAQAGQYINTANSWTSGLQNISDLLGYLGGQSGAGTGATPRAGTAVPADRFRLRDLFSGIGGGVRGGSAAQPVPYAA